MPVAAVVTLYSALPAPGNVFHRLYAGPCDISMRWDAEEWDDEVFEAVNLSMLG